MTMLSLLLSVIMLFSGMAADAPAEPYSRTLTVSGIELTRGDEHVDLDVALSLGVDARDKAFLLDGALLLDDQALFPVQLSVDEQRSTVLFKNCDTALAVDMVAGLAAAQQQIGAMAENSEYRQVMEMLTFLTREYMPAYAAMMKAAQDPALRAEIQAASMAAYDQNVDRGPGTATSIEIDGVSYDVTQYSYALDAAQIGALADAIYASGVPAVSDFYAATLKLYSYMPEESGLNGVNSLSDLMARFGDSMALNLDEWLSEDRSVQVMEGEYTVDLAAMTGSFADQLSEEEAQTIAQIEPMVMSLSSTTVDGANDAEVGCEWTVQQMHMIIDADSHIDGDDTSMNMTMSIAGQEDGEALTATLELSADQSCAGDAPEYSVDYEFNVVADGTQMNVIAAFNGDADGDTGHIELNSDEVAGGADYSRVPNDEGGCDYSFEASLGMDGNSFSLMFDGACAADGSSENTFSVEGMAGDVEAWSFSCDLDVSADPIANEAAGHDAYLIDDFSEEGLGGLMQDSGFTAALVAIQGSLQADAQALMANDSVQALIQMNAITGTEDYDYDYEFADEDGDDGDYEDFGEYEEPVDDGVLSFNQPRLTWLPEGWTVSETNVDTAFDCVDITLNNAGGDYAGYAMFFEGTEDEAGASYTLNEDGTLTQLEKPEVYVEQYEDMTLSATMNRGGVYTSLVLVDPTADLAMLGAILNGIAF